jgi:hypothetical protein
MRKAIHPHEANAADRERAMRTVNVADLTSMVVWWGTPVEAVNAFVRLAREGAMNETGLHQARTRLEAPRRTWVEVLPTESVRESRKRFQRRSRYEPEICSISRPH